MCKNFSKEEAAKSSTWWELHAIYFSMLSLKNDLAYKTVRWHTDNYAASCVFESGSNKIELQILSEEVFEVCKSSKIKISVKWVPRECIPRADALSKTIDHDDWETTAPFFAYLNNLWGPFTIDRFADSNNAKVQRFNSKFMCPGTEGVDAFLSTWKNENNFLVPPVYLAGKVLRHMQYYGTKGVLVVPY